MEKIKNKGLLYLSIDAVYQISLKSEMVGWTPSRGMTLKTAMNMWFHQQD
jgi:hypothetical protein